MARAFWAPASDPENLCDLLPLPPTDFLGKEHPDTCRIYPLWIAYLVLETASTPICELEPAFDLAADGLQQGTLCGEGHAFLCTYYLKKGLLDRSQSLLDRALRQEPDNPWVRLAEAVAEAVFFQEAYFDDQKAIRILEDLSGQYPSFSLVGYLLGKAYVREEEFGKAGTAFDSLKDDAKGQIAFWRIRRALTSLDLAAEQSGEKAEALLALSRAFRSLKDYAMAQDLYRWILEEMPGRLEKEEQTAAFCELAGIYEKNGDKSSAYDAYRDALEIDPGSPAAREGIRGLLSSGQDRS
jgi:tetratricopeptide (TPR) repeat protein